MEATYTEVEATKTNARALFPSRPLHLDTAGPQDVVGCSEDYFGTPLGSDHSPLDAEPTPQLQHKQLQTQPPPVLQQQKTKAKERPRFKSPTPPDVEAYLEADMEVLLPPKLVEEEERRKKTAPPAVEQQGKAVAAVAATPAVVAATAEVVAAKPPQQTRTSHVTPAPVVAAAAPTPTPTPIPTPRKQEAPTLQALPRKLSAPMAARTIPTPPKTVVEEADGGELHLAPISPMVGRRAAAAAAAVAASSPTGGNHRGTHNRMTTPHADLSTDDSTSEFDDPFSGPQNN